MSILTAARFPRPGGAAALSSADTSTGVTFATVGLRASSSLPIGTIATVSGMLGWRHAFGDTTPLATFAFAGGDAFAIAGAPIADDALAFAAGLEVDISAAATLGVSYSAACQRRARTGPENELQDVVLGARRPSIGPIAQWRAIGREREASVRALSMSATIARA